MTLRFAREGYPFIAISVGATAVFLLLGWQWLSLPMALLSIFVINFFRDPERQQPSEEQAILSPADGRVIKVARIRDDQFLHADATLISIFMSPLDVHVNRLPISGRVLDVRYRRGSYLRAYADEASVQNEQNAVLAEDQAGRRICFVQVAGFVARRIVSRLEPGMEIRRGERYGLIRFGSRADIYLPTDAAPAVAVGDRTTAGVTIIARWT